MRRLTLFAMLASLVVAACGDDDDEGAAPARPEPVMGVNVGELDNSPELLRREMRVMADSGVTTVRAPFYWNQAQPVRSLKDVPSGFRRAFRPIDGRPTTPLLLRNRSELGIQRIYWESWLTTDRNDENPFNFSGLRALQPDGTVREKPAFAAFRRVALRLAR